MTIELFRNKYKREIFRAGIVNVLHLKDTVKITAYNHIVAVKTNRNSIHRASTKTISSHDDNPRSWIKGSDHSQKIGYEI